MLVARPELASSFSLPSFSAEAEGDFFWKGGSEGVSFPLSQGWDPFWFELQETQATWSL